MSVLQIVILAIVQGLAELYSEFVDVIVASQPLALRDKMRLRLTYPERSIGEQFRIKALAIVVILVLGLLGGLIHHHESAGDFDACSYCHAGFQRPVIDLSVALAATTFAVVGLVAPSRPACLPRVVHYSTLVPRAPPDTTVP